jgi:hypothetical protein
MTPNLTFAIEGAEPMRFAAAPHMVYKLRIANDSGGTIHTIILKTQLQLDAARRRYSRSEQAELTDLFGVPESWGQTLRSLFWTHAHIVVPTFNEATVVDLPVPCSFDFNTTATKYFAGLQQGDVPVTFYFSGTIFYSADNGRLQVAHIPWEKEASYRLSVLAWRELMDAHYPNTAWLCLERPVFQRLYAYKTQHGLPSFEQALARVMDAVEGR